jgi:N-acetylglucosaminyldiphosphoundecaprenol N-acetyl-beta-D-mannosaminyltransferase
MSRKNRKNSAKVGLKTQIKPTKKMDKSIEILGVPLSGTQKSEVLRKMWLQRKEMLHVATVNPEYVMEARTDEGFRSMLTQCLTVVDGWGVYWASMWLGRGKVERVSGVELVEEILRHAEQKSEKVFLLGARSGVAERAAIEMRKSYPRLLVEWYEGARSVRVEKNEEASMTIARINAYEPGYLLVAYGSPYQDLWIEENRPYLRVRVAMGVGGVLDEWAGTVARCPKWIDQLGLKWLWRLVHEPWRYRRILKVFQFGWLVMYHKLID